MYTVFWRRDTKLDYIGTITLKESVDSIAYTAQMNIVVPDGITLSKGDSTEIVRNEDAITIFKGVIWSVKINAKHQKEASITCKERTVYIEKSEDEYMFQAGTTATQRAMQICRDWGIPVGNLADTEIALAKAPPKIGTIYGMMLDDLKETAEKGGDLFRYRMQNKLELVRIGSGQTYDITACITDISHENSLEGAVTKIKILGKKEDEAKSPVLGTFEKNTDKLGTLQKVIQDEKIQDNDTAKNKAEALFSEGKGKISAKGIDIPDIRAGDKVGFNGHTIYVSSISRNLGEPGEMELALESLPQIRRQYYANS